MVEKLKPADYDSFRREFKVEVPQNYNFAFDFVDRVAAEDGGRLALVHVDDALNRTEYDFAFMSEMSSKLANAMRGQGINKGDKVMIILYRRVEFWVTALALHKIGAIGIPSPNLLTSKDIEYRVSFADIRGVIAEQSVLANVDGMRDQCPGLKVFIQVGGKNVQSGWLGYEDLVAGSDDKFVPADKRAGGSDPMYIFFSSGTTGQPKMVQHPHTYPLGHIMTGMYWHDLDPGGLHFTIADTGWAKSVWGKFYGQWLAGAAVFAYDFRGKFSAENLLQVIADNKVTSFCGPPTVYRFLIREDLSRFDLSALRHCTTAGELLNDSVFTTWKKMTGLPIYEGYGQTETTLQIATFKCMEPKPGSIGRPCPGWDVLLLDDQDNICPPGVEGEICIKLPKDSQLGLFDGYLFEPEKTANVITGGYYHTGDKAWMDEDGYYWFLGRIDDLIKSSGYRIGPFEVESALITHPAIVEAAVTGVPDPVRGQAVKATVVLSSGFTGGDELTKELQAHVKKVTAPYKYPRIIDYVEELPKTISGKIKRAEIRAKDDNG